ncbi:PREDICTED: nucleolar protein 7 [Gavialis gangeticus]|uniref:nucleolar protein 7 n=1 Tax=Gavialis gangeticus TaxID=94835 RepID=UPI00092E9E29|nr:PREDICTED: nucleolar protein 7 [Gavialis gangeticus]
MVPRRRRGGWAEEPTLPAAVPFPPSSSSEEDEAEAPEEVPFERAKAEAEARRSLAEAAARRERAELRAKRRRRQELFKEQKEKKALPAAVLEALHPAPPHSENKESDSTNEGRKEDGSDNGIEEYASGEDSKDETVTVRLKEGYSAVCLKGQDLTSWHQQTAKDFIHNHLYGPGTSRTTANQFFSLANKTSQVKKPAVQFVKKSWGAEKKERAQRFKQHRISKLETAT